MRRAKRSGIDPLAIIASLTVCALVATAGCWTQQGSPPTGGTDGDSDSDGDSDTDSDSDSDGDTDTGILECDELPGYCCNANCSCVDPIYTQCVYTSSSWEDGFTGVCKEGTPDGNVCWSGDDCFYDHVCVDWFVCGCFMDCAEPDHLGDCVPGEDGCCDSSSSSSQCADGYFCADFIDAEDVCLRILNDNIQCWTDDDCAGGVGTCEGASLCSCYEDCERFAGDCVY